MSEERDAGAVADALRRRVDRSAFHRWAGLELERVAPGEVDVALDLQPHHLNLVGLAHGGMIATLADTAMGIALRTVLPEGRTHVTGQLNVHFLAPATGGRVVAHGRAVRAGRRMGYAEADVVDDRDRLLARASATFIVMEERGDATSGGDEPELG